MTDAPATGQTLRLGTRASALALWQANHVRDRLLAAWPDRDLRIELVKITTEGDRVLDRPLNEIGGRGLFVKGIEDELLADRIDLAVHSMKDLPGRLPPGLTIACTPPRADPRDALVGPPGTTLAGLPAGARLGTSSLRRAALARRIHPGIEVVPIRGNVPTRVGKIDEGLVDAVLLAAAGLQRLGLDAGICEYIDPDRMLPAACQGILAIETRADDHALAALLAPLGDPDTAVVAAAERAFLATLAGGCQVPIACHAQLHGDTLQVRGLVVDPEGEPLYEATASGGRDIAGLLGRDVANSLLAMGAQTIIDRLGRATP